MKGNEKLFLFFLVSLVLWGCVDNQTSGKNELPPPPQLFDGHLCDTLKERSRYKIKEGRFELVFDDTFTYAVKAYYLDSILEFKYHLYHTPVFDSNFKDCVQPIMDSAIAAKYGLSAKDSIINEAYGITEIVYKKENR